MKKLLKSIIIVILAFDIIIIYLLLKKITFQDKEEFTISFGGISNDSGVSIITDSKKIFILQVLPSMN